MAQKNKGFVSNTERYTTMLDEALVIHEKKEWFFSVCSMSSVWTRKKYCSPENPF